MRNKGIALALAGAMLCSLLFVGCAQSGGDGSASTGADGNSSAAMTLVGVAMASEESSGSAGEAVKDLLEEGGYTVELAYADTDTQQSEQISAMLEDGASILILDPVDSETAVSKLDSIMVDVSDVPVIVYRDVLEADSIAACISRDYTEMGRQQAEYLQEALQLDKATADDPVTLEFATGGNGGELALSGALEVLQPYLDAGTVQVLSGKTTAADCKVTDASAWVKELCGGLYAEQELGGILCLGNGQAAAAASALMECYPGKLFPTVTGADCSSDVIQDMQQNLIGMISIYDSDALVQTLLNTVQEATADAKSISQPEYAVNAAVTTADYQELLIDSGLYVRGDDGTYARGDGAFPVTETTYPADTDAADSSADPADASAAK